MLSVYGQLSMDSRFRGNDVYKQRELRLRAAFYPAAFAFSRFFFISSCHC
jgi:hypothetical protein